MFLLLFSLFSAAEKPSASITVTDSRYEEIYFEEPRVICTIPCSFEQDTSSIFVEANRHHRTWYRHGKITGIYNDETIKYAYDGCNFKTDPHGCAFKNSLWIMKTSVSMDAERASISVMIFDDRAAMIGQGTFTRFKKTRVIQRKKITQNQTPGRPGSISKCNKADGSCATIPFQSSGQTVSQSEDLEPIIIDIPPTLTARDIDQVMIMAYDSIR